MPLGSDVTYEGFVHVADPAPGWAGAAEWAGAGLFGWAAGAAVLGFGMTAIRGVAAICGIATLAAPASAAEPTVMFLTEAWRAPPAAPPSRLAVSPPATSTAQATMTAVIWVRDNGTARFQRGPDPGPDDVSAACLALISPTRGMLHI